MQLSEIDKNHLESILKTKNFGEIKNMDYISAGSSTENYIVTTTNSKVLARYYPPQFTDTGYEYRILSVLHKQGVPVPTQYHFEPTRESTRPFVLMEFIEGRQLVEVMMEDPQGERTRNLIVSFVKLLRSIHDLNWKDLYQTVNLPDYKVNPTAYAERVSNNRIREIKHAGLMEELQGVISWLDDNNKVPITSVHLLHSDFHPLNIIVKPNDDLIVLDWEGVDLGDHRRDVAFTALTLGVFGGHQQEEMIIKLYEQISGEKLGNLDFYLVVEALHRFVKFYTLIPQMQQIEPLYIQLFAYLKVRIEELTGVNLDHMSLT